MRLTFLLSLALLLCACGGDGESTTGTAGDPATEALPRPAGTSGSVTGMPDEPGPGPAETAPPEDALAGEIALGPDGLPLPPEAVEALDPDIIDPVDPAAVAPAEGIVGEAPDEPGPGEALAVVRAYYGAINAADYARAHALWATGASGQTLDQFAQGFADTASVVVDVESPGRIEGAAGSRYIEVPVAVEARQRDGGVRRFVGAYTLRRSVVDGASEAQRQWRIASADIREVRP
jgi:hypothetical protein